MIEGIYFANPNYLWLLSIIPIMVVWNILTWKKQQPTLKMPSLLNFKTGSSFLAKLYPFLYVFRLLSISLIILSSDCNDVEIVNNFSTPLLFDLLNT